MLTAFLRQEETLGNTLWDPYPGMTWLMPQLELGEARHQAKENFTLWRMQTFRNLQSWPSYVNTKLAKSVGCSFSSYRSKVSSNCGFPHFRAFTFLGLLILKEYVVSGTPERENGEAQRWVVPTPWVLILALGPDSEWLGTLVPFPSVPTSAPYIGSVWSHFIIRSSLSTDSQNKNAPE